MRILVFILLQLSMSFAAIAAEPFDFRTIDGRISFIESLSLRHPEIMNQGVEYGRPLIGGWPKALDVSSSLGDAANPLWLDQIHRVSAKYVSAMDEYDELKIENIKTALVQDFYRLTDALPNRNPTTLLNDLFDLRKVRPFDEREFRKKALRLLRLAPLIYDLDGQAFSYANSVDEMRARIKKLLPGEIDNLYNDSWIYHQSQLIERTLNANPDMVVTKVLGTHRREFLSLIIEPALIPKTSSGIQVEQRQLSLEEVPAAVALYRSNFGGDCSSLSIPYFSLVKETRVFLIRKSRNYEAKAVGYLLMTMVRVGEKEIPYVITTNGATLSSTDVAVAVHLAATVAESDFVVLPDFAPSKAFMVVNTAAAREGMTPQTSSPIHVEMPAGWAQAYRPTVGYENYYAKEKLQDARLASISNLGSGKISSVTLATAENPYHKSAAFSEMTLMEKAIWTGKLLSKEPKASDPEVAKALGLSPTFIRASRLLSKADGGLTSSELKLLQRQLGMTYQDMKRFSLQMRFQTISNLIDEQAASGNLEVKSIFEKLISKEEIEGILSNLNKTSFKAEFIKALPLMENYESVRSFNWKSQVIKDGSINKLKLDIIKAFPNLAQDSDVRRFVSNCLRTWGARQYGTGYYVDLYKHGLISAEDVPQLKSIKEELFRRGSDDQNEDFNRMLRTLQASQRSAIRRSTSCKDVFSVKEQ